MGGEPGRALMAQWSWRWRNSAISWAPSQRVRPGPASMETSWMVSGWWQWAGDLGGGELAAAVVAQPASVGYRPEAGPGHQALIAATISSARLPGCSARLRGGCGSGGWGRCAPIADGGVP